MPPVGTVFGNSPEPQMMNEPKSLHQSPAGANGLAFTQSCNRRRSWRDLTLLYGMVTLWRTDDALRVRVFDGLFIGLRISSAPAWFSLDLP
jgi:hypothetical protein